MVDIIGKTEEFEGKNIEQNCHVIDGGNSRKS